MAGNGCRAAYAILVILSTQILMLAFLFLLWGGVLYARESPKERDYAESICRVSSGKHWRGVCKGRRACYHVTWKVQHTGPRFTDATIETSIPYSVRQDAQDAVKDFSVGIVAST